VCPKTIHRTEARGSNIPSHIHKSGVAYIGVGKFAHLLPSSPWRSWARGALSLPAAPAAQSSWGNSPPQQHDPLLGGWRAGSERSPSRQGAFPNTLLPVCTVHWATCLPRPGLTTKRKTWCAGATHPQIPSS